MKITCSNDYSNAASSFTATTDASPTADLSNILTGDFSTSYLSGGTAISLVIERNYSTGTSASYVAIAGHNFGTIGGTLLVEVNSVSVGSQVFDVGSANNVVLFHFTEVATITQIRITFTKLNSLNQALITYVSAGDLLTLGSQNDEPAGYMRPWMVDSKKSRSVINDIGAPVAYLREQVTEKATLNLANVGVAITNSSEWQAFLNRVYTSGDFFIKENDGSVLADNPRSSYLCFDGSVTVKAHNATRQLNNLMIKFNAYTGR